MILSSRAKPKALWIVALLVALLLLVGCAGMEPYEPPDHQGEGPEKGLFTGSEGEFVILQKPDQPKEVSEDKKEPKEAESTAQPEDDSAQTGNMAKPPEDKQ